MPYRSVNPATGEVITTFANHTDAELQSALSVAHALYKSDWSNGPIQPRIEVLSRLADLLDCRTEELARVLTQEMGKRISEARSEVQLTAEIARFYAANAATFLASTRIQTPQGDAWVEYHPIGIIVAGEPWNFPYYQLVRVAGPNIAIGNPVLAKHASIVPRAAVAFAELVTEAAEGSQRIAEAGSNIGAGAVIEEVGAEGLVLALAGGVGGREELGGLRVR